MLPLLRIGSDEEVHAMGDVTELLAKEFKLTHHDRNLLVHSGRQTVFDNRVVWARTYLLKAGLLASAGRDRIRITERGLEVLKKDPGRIDVKLLRQFPEFLAFQTAKHEKEPRPPPGPEPTETPEERLESAHAELKDRLADDLLERVKQCPPNFFEQLVVDLLWKMGYGGSRADAAAFWRAWGGGHGRNFKGGQTGFGTRL